MNADFSRMNSLRTLHVPMVMGRGGLRGLGQSMNLAMGKAATQSSTSTVDGMARNASFALDGNRIGTFSDNSYSQTQNQLKPWWQVDLGQIYNIDKVDIYNVSGSDANRLSDFFVFVSDNAFTSHDPQTLKTAPGVFSSFFSGAAGSLVSVTVGRTGRFVKVQLSKDTPEVLNLAEVEVYGKPLQPGQTPTGTAPPGGVIITPPVSSPPPEQDMPDTTPTMPVSFLTQTFSLFGLNIPYYVPIAAGGVYYFFIRKKRRR